MGKFNTAANMIEENYDGFPGVKRTDSKQELATIVLNSMLNGDSFYEKESKRIEKVRNFVNVDPKFYAKAMVYTRNVGNLRSISHVMGVSLVETVKGKSWVRKALYKSLVRPDDATEMIALWNTWHPGKMIPNALRKAVKEALENRWDAYQLKKYYGNGSVKVSNLILISHPKPKDEAQEKMFKQAIEGKLPPIETAQTINAGKSGEERVQSYKKLMSEGKLGVMATLKNLKNILEVDSSKETIDLIEKTLNKEAIEKSKVLPFRFAQAYEAVRYMTLDVYAEKSVTKILEKAFKASAKNVKIAKKGERVAMMLDESGSMDCVSKAFFQGKVLLAAANVSAKKGDVINYLWSNTARRVDFDTKAPLSWIFNTKSRGGGTELSSAISELIETKTKVDKMVVFTDMQENMVDRWSSKPFRKVIAEYKKEVNPDLKVLFWNLEGYGGAAPVNFKDRGFMEVAGFSEKMLEVVLKLWDNPNALVEEIESISID